MPLGFVVTEKQNQLSSLLLEVLHGQKTGDALDALHLVALKIKSAGEKHGDSLIVTSQDGGNHEAS